MTKHGLAEALRSDDPTFESLHAWFLDTLVPVCGELLDAARAAGEVHSDVAPETLMFAVGNLCIGASRIGRAETLRLVDLLVAGLRTPTG